MIVEVAESVVDDGFARRTELGVLTWVGGQPMAEFCGDLSDLGERFGGKGGELVAILGMRGKRKHFAAKTHEFDAITIVPAEHLGYVTDVGQA